MLLSTTPLRRLALDAGRESDRATDSKQRVGSVSGTGIPELAQGIAHLPRERPHFVYAHVYSPHGPRLSAEASQTIFDYSPAQIREHLSILNAIRLPAECRGRFEPDSAPIDTQRLVFACLGGHAPRYEVDRHFLFSPRRTPASERKIREVTIHSSR